MKKRKYTRKKKAGALFLFILFMGIAVSGGLGLYYINNFSNFLFSKTELLQTTKFEDTELMISANYHEILVSSYGNDYMTPKKVQGCEEIHDIARKGY